MSRRLRIAGGLQTIGVTFVLLASAYVALPVFWQEVPEPVKEMLLVFTIIAGVHLVERGWAWEQFVSWNRRTIRAVVRIANSAARSMRDAGITRVYLSRLGLEPRAYRYVRAASRRVWLLGVAFSETVRLDELLETLDKQVQRGVDIKLLLLDPLRSPGVYRMFLESPQTNVERVLATDRSHLRTDDPAFDQRLFRDCESAFKAVKAYTRLAPRTKFYGQSPACWMIMADDVAFFQPYTLGQRSSSMDTNLCLGAQMPVFEFREARNPDVFSALVDHFAKVWVTSDVDMFHMQARWADRERLLARIMTKRRHWLKHVHAVLTDRHAAAISERRTAPRQLCRGARGTISWPEARGTQTRRVVIRDCSRSGLGLRLLSGLPPSGGTDIAVAFDRPLPNRAAESIVDDLLARCGAKFVVADAASRPAQIVGLQARVT